MAIVRFGGFNEGSLLRRTLIHVITFVVGALAFVTLLSFVLVTVAKGLLPQRGAASAKPDGKGEEVVIATDDGAAAAPVSPLKSGIKPRKPRKPAAAPTDE